MADSAATTASLPPPPVTGAAPGQAGYQNGSNSHMPPPLNIPQNNNNVPAAVSSALGEDLTSPMSAGPRRAAPEPNKRALYVGGLDPRVTEDVLKQIFETTGHVQNVKIIPDKNVSTRPYLHLPRDNITTQCPRDGCDGSHDIVGSPISSRRIPCSFTTNDTSHLCNY